MRKVVPTLVHISKIIPMLLVTPPIINVGESWLIFYPLDL